MKKKLILSVLLCLLGISWAIAQSTTVSGTVTSADDGEPLIGATVQVKGTAKYATTNAMGQYQIAAEMSDVLIFQFTGAIPQEVKISRNVINVSLAFEAAELEEVMVVAYGTAKKANFTGSAGLVKKDALEKSQVSSVSKALQGTVAGVQSISMSGQPGSDASIYIRGVGSINANTQPLYVVDGVPYDGALSNINTSDIESVTVLKDAASSSLYGSRGANGVVIITTKQGRKDQPTRIDAKVTYGISDRAIKDYKQVSTQEYWELYWEACRNERMYINGSTPEVAAQWATDNIVGRLVVNPYGTNNPKPVGTDGKLLPGLTPLWEDNWHDLNEQDATRFEAILGISGGSKTSAYYASFGYLNDIGMAIGSDFKRYTGRLNLSSDLKKWLKFSGNIALTHSNQGYPTQEDTRTSNVINASRLRPDFYPAFERDLTTGDFILDKNGNKIWDFGSYRPSGAQANDNLPGSMAYNKQERKRDAATIRTSLELLPYKGFSFKSSFNSDFTNRNDLNYNNPLYGSYVGERGQIYKYNARTVSMTINNILSYNTRINDLHGIKALIGHEYYEYNTSNMSGTKQGVAMPNMYEPVVASNIVSMTGLSDKYKLLSFLSNFEYDYNSKYFVSASLRTDGSSRFHPDSRWGLFWSVGASWRAVNEDFMKPVTWLSNLTLRASYGAQGNDDLNSYYLYQDLYTIYNNLGEPGLYASRLPTPDLKWETNLNLNIGLDFGILNNRLTGTFEFFERNAKDQLFDVPTPESIGYRNIAMNIGDMKNTGFEISITGTPIKTKDWTWELHANATHYKNKITSLPNKFIDNGNKRLTVGGTMYDFFLVEWAGVDPTNGRPQWWMNDASGNRVKTHTYTDANKSENKVFAGTSLPDLTGGFGTNLKYKNIDFSVLFAYVLGGKIYNGDITFMMHTGNSAGRAWPVDIKNRWTPENPNTNVPRLQLTTHSFTSSSTRFLVDADYLRLKNVTLGYTLPKKWMSKISVSQCKVFVQGENLLTFFGEQGMDPEQTVGGSTYYRYPAMKTFSCGINLSF